VNDLCLDIGFGSLSKHGEQLCGDQVVVARGGEDDAVIVLADGMGSGVKANILATLTAKILSTMMSNGMSIDECVSTVAATLPVCKVRRAAYSTFTAIRLTEHSAADIVQYDNPDVIVLKDGKNADYPRTAVVIDDKTVYLSKLHLAEDDALVLISDGVVHTGLDGVIDQTWDRDVVAGYMEYIYDRETSAKNLATLLLNECLARYGGKVMDDTTVCVVKIRKRRQVNLMIGPPADRKDDEKMMSLFFAKEGRTIICGGTTASIAARFLGQEIKTVIEYADGDIPPTSELRGVDLVTEGVLTVNRVMDYALDYLADNNQYYKWCYLNDGASRIARLLF
jgi:serine/threonine protein phosphatase PrpC